MLYYIMPQSNLFCFSIHVPCKVCFDIFFLLSLAFVYLQEQKLQSEIDNLNTQLRDRDDFIKSRKSSLAAIENNINQSNEGFITSKGQRDKLQDERK